MKKFLAVFLSICMMLSLGLMNTLAVDAGTSEQFSDMPQDYSTAALEAAVANGLLSGYEGKLMPSDSLTRAQMGTILVRAFGGQKSASLAAFQDIPAGAWYNEWMAKAVFMKAFQGDGSRMSPNRAITRQEAFVVLSSLLDLPQADTSVLNKFSDVASIADWAKPGVAAMVNAGLVNGSDGKLDPNRNITRAQFAVVMNGIVKNYITEAGEYTSVGEGSVMINVPGVTLKNVTIDGNLILGDGVGEGNITLDNVTVTGRVVVRGGGVNSIVICGDSKINSITVSKVDGDVRVAVEDTAAVATVVINDGKDDVIIEGKVENVTVAAEVPVVVQNAEVSNLKVTATNATVTVAEDAKVAELTVQKSNVALSVAGQVTTLTTQATATEISVSGTVGTVNAAAEGAVITGDGKVTTANVTADNVKVDTVGTTTKVGSGVIGTTSNGYAVAGGSTSTTTETKPAESTSDDGDSGTTTTYYKLTLTITDGTNTVTAATTSSTLAGSTPFYAQAVTLISSNRAALQEKFGDSSAAALMDAGIAAQDSDSDWATFVDSNFGSASGASETFKDKNATFAQLVGTHTITYSGYTVTVTIAAI